MLSVLDDLPNGPAAPRNDRRAAGHGFDHHEAKRFGPIDRKKERDRLPKERRLFCVTDLPNELDQGIVQQRLYVITKVVASAASTLAAILSRMPSRLAMVIARSGRFSGEMRPKKAR